MTNRRRLIEMTGQEVQAFLGEERVAVVSSLGPRGWPHSMPLWYVVRNERIFADLRERQRKRFGLVAYPAERAEQARKVKRHRGYAGIECRRQPVAEVLSGRQRQAKRLTQPGELYSRV